MRIIFRISDFGFRIDRQNKGAVPLGIRNPQSAVRNRSAFTLVEVMVVIVLLALIVMALMAVFNSTQTAFRASITQTDVLESGRATMDLMAGDLRAMSPSRGLTYGYYTSKCGNTNFIVTNGVVNFYANTNVNQQPLIQPLVAGSSTRTNVLESFFILSRQNQTWTGVGYVVNASSSSPLYPLYRFSMSTNVAFNPWFLFYNFTNAVGSGTWTNMSHLMDGVVHLTVQAFDINGTPIYFVGTNIMTAPLNFPCGIVQGPIGYAFYSNALPASVEVEMGVLEDRALQRAESLGIAGQPPSSVAAQWSYLTNSAGRVHIFRQRVSIPNVDPSAYQ